MRKIFFILPVISILYFSCKKNSASTPPTQHDTLPPPPPPLPPPPIDTLADGWEKIQLAYSSVLNDIFFINNTGFAIGGATILKSSDGGNTWSQLTIPPGMNSLFNMGMGNEKNAIFVGGQGQLAATQDGGVSFTTPSLADNISDVFFVDSITAYAGGTNIWKTSDAGNNWVKLYSFSGDYTSSLYFLNAQIGWVFSNYGLYRTVNGGLDWTLIPTQFDNGRNMAVFFPSSDTGYISRAPSYGGHYSQRTVDGGVSWTTIFAADGGPYLDIHFVSDKTGYIIENRRMYKTLDGGNTWTGEVTLVSNTFIELHFIDPNHGWACGDNGTILKYSR